MQSVLLDAAGHRRSPATMPGYHQGRPPRNKGEQYPADPPTVEEIVAVMRTVGDRADGHRLRALIVLLWRAGLRISKALALQESDLDSGRGAVLVRRGKGGKRREVGMDRWAWQQLEPWLEIRRALPIGAVLCVIHGPTAGRRWEASAARKQLHHAAAAAGVRRRFAPHQLRHAHAVEMAHEGVPLVVIQRQLGHANLGITSIYLQGIDSSKIISTVHGRPSPTISANAGLQIRRYNKHRVGRRIPTDPPHPRLANTRCVATGASRPAFVLACASIGTTSWPLVSGRGRQPRRWGQPSRDRSSHEAITRASMSGWLRCLCVLGGAEPAPCLQRVGA